MIKRDWSNTSIKVKELIFIHNVMQPSPKNNIKIVEIDQKKLIHFLIMKNGDE